jgi:predicted nucleic acid-binding protein
MSRDKEERSRDANDDVVEHQAEVVPYSPDAALWATRSERGLVRLTTVTRLEVGYSARSGSDLRTGLKSPPLAAMPVEYLTPAIEDRALEVLALLADHGQHRPRPCPTCSSPPRPNSSG